MNVENLVRSGVALVIGLPLTIGVLVNALPEKNEANLIKNKLKAELTEACLKYVVSKNDSKLERLAKNEIDEIIGGEVNYIEACKWVL
jgi:selenophosphate synthase